MRIQILGFYPDFKGMKLGDLDVQVFYPGSKEEIFRGLTVLKKEGKMFALFGNVKRGEKWLPRYERNPVPKELFSEINAALYEYSIKNPDLFITPF